MKATSLQRQFKHIAQMGGFALSYWSVCEISLGNDRTPEMGSRRTVV